MKVKILKRKGKFRAYLIAKNGLKLMHSEQYNSRQAAMKCLNVVAKAFESGDWLEVREDRP